MKPEMPISAFSAAAQGRFDDHRITDLPCKLLPRFRVRKRLCAARHHRHTCGDHGISGFLLISQLPDDLRPGTDKCNITLFAQFGKPAVFRKEPKTRVDRVRPGDNGGADDLFHAQIA